MKRVTIRETSAELPNLPDEAELARVDSLGAEGGSASRFELTGTRFRALDVQDVRLLDGRVHSVHSEATRVKGLAARSVEFTGCELGDVQWTGGKLSRTRFDGCKLLAARFENVTLDNVVFSDCKLDYAALSHVRTTGPVLFVRCSMREAEFRGCNLARSLFDDCDLRMADFGPGGYRGCDLRGNDLSAIRGTHHLNRVVIDRSQLLQLAYALAADLEVSFGDASSLAASVRDPGPVIDNAERGLHNREGRRGPVRYCESCVDGRDARQVVEARLGVSADQRPSCLCGVGRDDQVVGAARPTRPAQVGQQLAVVGRRGDGVVEHVDG
jgi:uncharacterized protein YjbI with pentapeptide repeats